MRKFLPQLISSPHASPVEQPDEITRKPAHAESSPAVVANSAGCRLSQVIGGGYRKLPGILRSSLRVIGASSTSCCRSSRASYIRCSAPITPRYAWDGFNKQILRCRCGIGVARVFGMTDGNTGP